MGKLLIPTNSHPDSHNSHCNATKITNNPIRVRGEYGNDPKEEEQLVPLTLYVLVVPVKAGRADTGLWWKK